MQRKLAHCPGWSWTSLGPSEGCHGPSVRRCQRSAQHRSTLLCQRSDVASTIALHRSTLLSQRSINSAMQLCIDAIAKSCQASCCHALPYEASELWRIALHLADHKVRQHISCCFLGFLSFPFVSDRCHQCARDCPSAQKPFPVRSKQGSMPRLGLKTTSISLADKHAPSCAKHNQNWTKVV